MLRAAPGLSGAGAPDNPAQEAEAEVAGPALAQPAPWLLGAPWPPVAFPPPESLLSAWKSLS